MAGDQRRIVELQDRVLRQAACLYSIGKHSSSFIKGVKCALSCLGICDDGMAEPFQRFQNNERRRVQQALRQLGIDRAPVR